MLWKNGSNSLVEKYNMYLLFLRTNCALFQISRWHAILLHTIHFCLIIELFLMYCRLKKVKCFFYGLNQSNMTRTENSQIHECKAAFDRALKK